MEDSKGEEVLHFPPKDGTVNRRFGRVFAGQRVAAAGANQNGGGGSSAVSRTVGRSIHSREGERQRELLSRHKQAQSEEHTVFFGHETERRQEGLRERTTEFRERLDFSGAGSSGLLQWRWKRPL